MAPPPIPRLEKMELASTLKETESLRAIYVSIHEKKTTAIVPNC